MEHSNAMLSPITRRDPIICGRAVPVIESMVAICIVDDQMVARKYEAMERVGKECTI
jgi:chorismate synthase